MPSMVMTDLPRAARGKQTAHDRLALKENRARAAGTGAADQFGAG
jgi:hypothetical protein